MYIHSPKAILYKPWIPQPIPNYTFPIIEKKGEMQHKPTYACAYNEPKKNHLTFEETKHSKRCLSNEKLFYSFYRTEFGCQTGECTTDTTILNVKEKCNVWRTEFSVFHIRTIGYGVENTCQCMCGMHVCMCYMIVLFKYIIKTKNWRFCIWLSLLSWESATVL